jgi:SAM-dependent methyltransferase
MAVSQMLNIGCGDSYLESWLNLDYVPHSAYVRQANLLDRLPISDNSTDVVYSSHFLEHIPRNQVVGFLNECYRVTKLGGTLRLVLPDWEELCSTYLSFRREGQHDKADFLMLEMLDQCVRRVPGGELGAYYAHLQASPHANKEMAELVRQRTGHDLQSGQTVASEKHWVRIIKNPKKILSMLERVYCRAVIALLPSAYRQQNISLTSVGEKHAWMYDFYTVEYLLLKAGFIDVQRVSATTSNIPDFPFYPLDVMEDGLPRKGAESMYIEAVKP